MEMMGVKEVYFTFRFWHVERSNVWSAYTKKVMISTINKLWRAW